MASCTLSTNVHELWECANQFLNSPFVSAFLSALAGAWFGATGARRIAERAEKKSELLDALRQANAIVVLAATVTNNTLALKKQHIAPLTHRYSADQVRARAVNESILNGTPVSSFHFQAELTKVTPASLPLEALKNLVFSAKLMPGRALALAAMIDQSATELAHSVSIRSDLIDRFHASNSPPDVFCREYFGLPDKDGSTNAFFADSMTGIKQYTDDLAFFSAELAEELADHAKLLHEQLEDLRAKPRKATSVDFSAARESGLLLPREEYDSWLSGFKKAS